MRVLLLVLLATVACSSSSETVEVVFEVEGGRAAFRAEVARTPEEKARGLMGRDVLAADAGMLFVWDEVAPRAFHMLDTLIPLDLISIRAGRVVGVQRMVPCPSTSGCPVTTTPPADAALEVAAGTAERAGIEPGALVDAAVLR